VLFVCFFFAKRLKIINFYNFFFTLEAYSAPTDFPGTGHDWSLVPDDQGKLHLVDLNPIKLANVEPEPAFNAEADVIFTLFTRANPTNGQVIIINNAASLAASNFNPANPTRYFKYLIFTKNS